MKAFNLVRQHFGVLRDVIAANRGALVKTIGDAVMASFHEPLNAIRAALDMLAQIRRFNDSVGEELITLKIGAHVGHCLAVTLNGRLDYFGQTVNLAARVQGLAAENDIYMSDEIYRLPGAADLLAASSVGADRPRQGHRARDRRSRIALPPSGEAVTVGLYLLQCVRPLLMWWTAPAPDNEFP